jgi:hypothetical protein
MSIMVADVFWMILVPTPQLPTSNVGDEKSADVTILIQAALRFWFKRAWISFGGRYE